MAYELQELMLEDESDEETQATLSVAQYNSDEDREDDILDEEYKQAPPAPVPNISGKTRLEALRMYLENNLGKHVFDEAYTLIKLIDETNVSQSNYERYTDCLNQCLNPQV